MHVAPRTTVSVYAALMWTPALAVADTAATAINTHFVIRICLFLLYNKLAIIPIIIIIIVYTSATATANQNRSMPEVR